MKMKVVDQLHLSSLGPDTMGKDTQFEVSDDVGKDLQKRGLATLVDAETGEKAERPPRNKVEAAPKNKSGAARKRAHK